MTQTVVATSDKLGEKGEGLAIGIGRKGVHDKRVRDGGERKSQ